MSTDNSKKGDLNMTKEDFARNLFSLYDVIIIDTSSLMNVENIHGFIEKYELLLMELQKKVSVCFDVWAELNKMSNSDNMEKQERAVGAIATICMHRNIFNIEEQYVDQTELMNAFADPKLLSMLTVNKRSCKQLFITNDRGLAQDAIRLNKLDSCKGHEIYVCHLVSSGDLIRNTIDIDEQIIPLPETKIIIREVEKPVYIKQNQTGKNLISRCLSSGLVLTVGYWIGKNQDKIINYSKKLIAKFI